MKLLIAPADGPSFEYEFDGDSLVIGRASTADLLIPDPFLSRHHARLYRHDGRLFVEDLDSRNGTELNGEPVHASREVGPGDRINVSGSSIDLDFHSGNHPIVDLEATVLRPAREFLHRSELETRTGPADAQALRTQADRLHRLNEIHREIAKTLNTEALSSVLLERALAELRPEHASLILLEGDGSYRSAGSLSAERAGPEPPISRRLIAEVCGKGMSALINDVARDERFADSKSLILAGARSLAAAPLLDDHGTLGMLVVNSAAVVREFDEDDLGFLTSMASVAALKIRNLRLAEAAIARQRHEQELKIARRIQRSLLPATLPSCRGLSLFARNIPSQGVSGDFFEITALDGGRRCLVLVVDVSGKGIPASLLTASIEALASGPIEESREPHEVLEIVSRRLYDRTPPEKYATAFLAIVDGEEGEVRFAMAGHNPSMVIRQDGSVELLECAGRPLGLVRGSTYEAGVTRLEPGDSLVAYTDGITEAANAGQEEYGLDRLGRSCSEHRREEIDTMGRSILAEVHAFTGDQAPDDDCTLIVVRRDAPEAPAAD